ncbi:hypothetical protein F2P56_016193, partial [Juglans regia]
FSDLRLHTVTALCSRLSLSPLSCRRALSGSLSRDLSVTLPPPRLSEKSLVSHALVSRSQSQLSRLSQLNSPVSHSLVCRLSISLLSTLSAPVSLPICLHGMVGLSLGEKNFIQGGIAQDLRSDGRKRLTYRPVSVETGVIPQANGSARVRMGATDVISSVKAELGKPSSLQPDKGKVSIYVDCSPTAAPMFEGRGGDELSTDLSVALQCCLLGGKSGAGTNLIRAREVTICFLSFRL